MTPCWDLVSGARYHNCMGERVKSAFCLFAQLYHSVMRESLYHVQGVKGILCPSLAMLAKDSFLVSYSLSYIIMP